MPWLVAAHAALERRAGISQVEDLADDRAQLPGVGERRDLEQLLAVGLDDEVEGAISRPAAASVGGSSATETSRPPRAARRAIA